MATRPITTLFMLMSLDGKISTGDSDLLDFDRDLPQVPGVATGLHQYYDLEKQTDAWSLNTGRVFAKIGLNEGKVFQTPLPVSFVIIDNKPHLSKQSIETLVKNCVRVVLVTNNHEHPALALVPEHSNLVVIEYQGPIDFADLFAKLKSDQSCERLTVQSGGTLNAELLRAGLIDHLSIVVAPLIVGGKDTSTLVDGDSLHTLGELAKLCPLELAAAQPLKHSYLHLKYNVLSKD